ncbi:hypothetical protein K437DRAFT_289492 [Tilletiaria anomala UBC 951]|uniref:t-SNARE coiled-coil homology domain-containing protein n=1 Tax=Tilletiaria anomala (strain ATCC 24038 / CBS 436.72 / UBC 951) TaxID=1037660 RepID=A0A066WRJ6_TILAU|nr:uncharacterized protein K437DRAFT_289492 [Tilletiaria anomala UBC 951]KDN53624.1 hypothetical protein K437DRAFT_289492 [Tilletiaria anomala UBC 951]
MSRRHAAGVADRYALLNPSGGGAGPSASYPSSLRSSSPFEQPYGGSNASSSAAGPSRYYAGGGASYPGSAAHSGRGTPDYSEYGAPKKENGLPAGPGLMSGALGGGSWGSYAQQRTAEDLEEGNDIRVEGLSAKVKMLKDITIGIGNEVRDGNADLSTLSDAFETTTAFLGNTFHRMNRMATRQGGWWCNMMIFLIVVIWIFVLLWFWRR